MLTVFNGADGYPISNDNYYVRELASGLDEIVFEMSIRDPIYKYVVEEARIRDRDGNYYLVKQIDAGNDRAKIVAQIDIDDFRAVMYENYTNGSATVYNTVLSVLPAGWTCTDRSNVIIRRTIPTSDTTTDYNVTAWKVLQDCCNVYKVRFRFDNVRKVIYILNPLNFQNIGAFATRDLNLRELNYKGKSNDFCTRLYAEGADGMTFADINDGKNYVDNNTYSNKVISAYWKDERYTDKESLLADAISNLAEMAQPKRSYDCDVLDLANTNPEIYGFEDFSLFSVITLIDDAKGERLNYQIVEKWNYPYYPVKNKVVLSTETPKIQNQVVSIIEAINNPTSGFQQIMQSAIANSTALITGNKGGYVVLHDSNNDGVPDEILIMDTPSIETAMKVWRWNASGLGYSSTGYDGQFGLAMTIDGAIVADFITAGTLDGNIIRAASLGIDSLSKSAQEKLNALHDYLPYDVMTNISRWEINASPVSFSTITIDNIDYECLTMDGTSITSYAPSYQTQVKSNYQGQPTITIDFDYIFDRDVSIAQQQQFYLYYRSNGGYYTTRWEISGDYEAHKVYHFHAVNTLAYSVDVGYTPRIGFRFIPNAKTYIANFTVTGLESEYERATLTVTPDGLSSVVQKGGVISAINQSAESVTISANKIDLSGDLNLKGSFIAKDNSSLDDIYAQINEGQVSIHRENATIGEWVRVRDDSGTVVTSRIDFRDQLGNPLAYIGGFSTSVNTLYVDGDASFNQQITAFGTAQFYGTVLNSSGGVVFISDKRKKKNIKDLAIEKAKSFIMALKPREFRFKKGISTSNRKHHGFIAQEVNEAMREDWGVYIEDKEKDFIGLRYDELIADMVAVIQDQEKRITALERKLNNDKSNI